jgi:predicted Zn finger-like uncharacterized protein
LERKAEYALNVQVLPDSMLKVRCWIGGRTGMKKGDVTCPECRAGFRRIELASMPPSRGEYHCPVCSTVLEKFDGTAFVAYRLSVEPVNKTVGNKDHHDDPLSFLIFSLGAEAARD